MSNIFIEQKFLDKIKSIIKKTCPKAIVWAYGSRVDGDAHEGSDLDLVIKDFGQEEAYLFEIQEALQESNIPFLIEMFQFDRLPKSFQTEIEKKHIVIYNGQIPEDCNNDIEKIERKHKDELE